MSKEKTFLHVILIITILSTSYFGIISLATENNVNEPNNKNTSDAPTLKSSAATVTSLRNFTIGGTITNLEISADGNYIVVATNDYHLLLFNESSSNPMWNFTIENGNAVDDLAISANGTYIAVGMEGGVALFNNTYSTQKTPMWNYTSLGGYGKSVAISRDGIYIAVGSWDYKIYLFNNTYSTSKTPMWSYATQNYVDSVAISADGTYITGGGVDDTVYFLNKTYSTSKTEMWKFNTTSDIKSIDISIDGKYIVAAHSNTNGGNLSYFDTMEKIRLWKYDHQPGYSVDSVDMSGDGKYLVSSGAGDFKAVAYLSGFFDNSIISPKTSLWNYPCNSYTNWFPKISLDGYYVAVGRSNNVTLLDQSSSVSKDYIWSYQLPTSTLGVAISDNSSHVAAAGNDKRVYLLYWDVPEHPISRLPPSSGGGGDDDGESPQIPYGNFYLFFLAISVFSLIVIVRRKLILK